ncbi:MAG: MarR family transcriptional regulator [Rhodothermales bacterium]
MSTTMTHEEALGYVAQAEQVATEAALAVCWAQWRSLGALATAQSTPEAQSIIDPEALLLLTLQLRDRERRLDDFAGWWASTRGALMSVQRVLNLAKLFPSQAADGVGGFARLAAAAGHKRWKRHQHDQEHSPLKPRPSKGSEAPTLHNPPALLLRLRAGLGVGAKADLLAFLLGLRGERVTTRQMAEALHYTEVAIRTAAQDMARAGFIDETRDRPVRYAARLEVWAPLLQFTAQAGVVTAPGWCYGAECFALLAATQAWAEAGRVAGWSPYVWSSRARDLTEQHRRALEIMRLPRPDRHRGADYLPAFVQLIEQAGQWMRAQS